MDSRRVLIVDDEKNIRFSLSNALEKLEVPVETADSGEEALGKLTQADYDLMLLDLRMPGMDGLAVCDKLRYDPKTRDVPIIFLSAKGDDDTVALASVLDAYAFIRKPFKPQELLGEVRNCLNIFGGKSRGEDRKRKRT